MQPRHEQSEVPDEAQAQPDHPVAVASVDHLVPTVTDIDQTIGFYQRVLGMHPVTFEPGRHALQFGSQELNLHAAGHEIEPHAAQPTAGSADLCLLTTASPDRVVAHLAAQGVSPESGPVTRTGARGAIRSFYIRDPDGNLIEVASYPSESTPRQAN